MIMKYLVWDRHWYCHRNRNYSSFSSQGTHISERGQCEWMAAIQTCCYNVYEYRTAGNIFLKALGSYWGILRQGRSWPTLQILKTKRQMEIIFSGSGRLSPLFFGSSAMCLEPLARLKLRVWGKEQKEWAHYREVNTNMEVIDTSEMLKNIIPFLWPCS